MQCKSALSTLPALARSDDGEESAKDFTTYPVPTNRVPVGARDALFVYHARSGRCVAWFCPRGRVHAETIAPTYQFVNNV